MDIFTKRYEEKANELKHLNNEQQDVLERRNFIEESLKNALVRKQKIEQQIHPP